MKKLYKNEHNEIFTGVIGGIGEYFSVDPTVIRVGFTILVLITGIFPGIIAYIIAYFIIPDRPHGVSTLVTPPPMKTPEPVVTPEPTNTPETTPAPKSEPVIEEKIIITPESVIESKIETIEKVAIEHNTPHIPKWPVTEETLKDIPILPTEDIK
ncbi:MAG: PspC domain-containing protein [Minisyncoccota bacterium]